MALFTVLLSLGQGGATHSVLAQKPNDNYGGRKTVKYTPGQRLVLRIVNRSMNPLTLRTSFSSRSFSLIPGQQAQFQWAAVPDDFSVLFWDQSVQFLQAVVKKPNATTVRIELHSSNRNGPDDGAVHFMFDGWVRVD
ncbi:MAG: hypothetical protein RBJ76_05715 [Stenomitos frigidus ULC029]